LTRRFVDEGDRWSVTADSGLVLDHQQLRIDTRLCAWCRRPIDATARVDAIYDTKKCRQAAWKFGRARIVAERAEAPMRFAYLDPPYPGNARRLYGDHADYRGEVDHALLIRGAVGFFPDGWALSTSAAALSDVLELVLRSVGSPRRSTVRVCPWVRGLGSNGLQSHPLLLNTWEPVIVVGGRAKAPRPGPGRRLDSLVHTPRARTSDPNRVKGAKPAAFCWWLFDLLGAQPGDELVDLFPGSGGVARAWDLFSEAA
jgi:hypothetical protein